MRQHIVATSPLKMRVPPWLVLVSLAGAACAAPASQARPAAAPAAPAPALEPAMRDRDWGVLRSAAHGMKLALPEARSWFVAATVPSGAGWELRHEPTGSALSLRRWRSSRIPQLQQCELELRQRVAGLVPIDESSLVGERRVRAPQGFVTKLSLVATPSTGPRLLGQAVAVGAGVGECIAAIARTECMSEAELAERLRLFDVALSHLRLSNVEDRVPEPKPLQP